MPAEELGVVDAAGEVLLARVHARVEVAEQLGHGLDALPGRAGRRVGRLGRLEIAGLDGRHERRELGLEHGGLLEDVRLVLLLVAGQRRGVDDVAGRLGGDAATDRQRAARRAQGVAHELVVAAVEAGREVDDEARDDVLDLVDDAVAVRGSRTRRCRGRRW